jgi:hypothetical protein
LNVFWIMVGIVGMLRASDFAFIEFKTDVLHWLVHITALSGQ